MAYTFNPTPAEANTLAQIASRESGGGIPGAANYAAFYSGPLPSHASGAYQFQPDTWAMAAAATGVGGQYANAKDAPAWMQDTNALWLLRYTQDPNSSMSWGASGPYVNPYDLLSSSGIPGSSTQPLIDLSGSAATASTSDILSSLNLSSMGIALSNPLTDIALMAGAAAVLWVAMRR